MPRNSAGEFYLSPGTAAVRDQTAHSAHVNQRFADLQFDANYARPILAGGTGASTAAGARENLGVPATSAVALLAGSSSFTAPQTIDTTNAAKLTLRGSGTTQILIHDSTGARVCAIEFNNTANNFLIFIDPAGGMPSARLDLNRDGSLKVNGQAVYHAGNRPSASDVGAVSATRGAVGSMAFLSPTIAVTPGQAVAAVLLSYAGQQASGALVYFGTPPGGEWQAIGECPANGATLFIRTS